jgi:hypothetical protein
VFRPGVERLGRREPEQLLRLRHGAREPLVDVTVLDGDQAALVLLIGRQRLARGGV